MSLEILSLALEFLGTLLVAITAIRVHLKIEDEKRIDGKVISQIQLEKMFGYLGILLLIIGFSIELLLRI